MYQTSQSYARKCRGVQNPAIYGDIFGMLKMRQLQAHEETPTFKSGCEPAPHFYHIPFSGGSRLEYIAKAAPYFSQQSHLAYATDFSAKVGLFEERVSPSVGEYSARSFSSGYSCQAVFYNPPPTQKEYHFVPAHFLKPGKEGLFVGEADQIRPYVEEAFEKIFQQKFPTEIKISLLKEEKFRQLAPHPATVGLSLNRSQQGLLSEIFVLNGPLGKVMLTLGHELGHVLTETLENPHDEEAKAYAFSLEWMRVIKENDIAGLGKAIILEVPALNGLHNVAFEWVHNLIRQGRKAGEIYLGLVRRALRFLPQEGTTFSCSGLISARVS